MVAFCVLLTLASLTMVAMSAASLNVKRMRTRAIISKLDAIISAQFTSYASRSVDAGPNSSRGEILRAIAKHDLPDSWQVVQRLADNPAAVLAETGLSELTPPQRAYVAAWESQFELGSPVVASNDAAECLFLTVMFGGLADCLDCGSLRAEVGDTDNDGAPEFLDAWDRPIGFVYEPKDFKLPAVSGTTNFFSSSLPFDPVIATSGVPMRPLIVSAGSDGQFGLAGPTAAPTADWTASRDNVTNFDEEAGL